MTAVGANKVKWIAFGVVPQALSSFMSYVLFAFEINIRASAGFRSCWRRWYWVVLRSNVRIISI